MFDPEQEEAVSFFEGVCLAIAGPGAGKTSVLTHRVLRLIRTGRVAADRILVLTYTREAAAEMQNRFLAMAGEEGLRVVFGTFHSVFFRILREERGYASDSLLGKNDRILLAMEALMQMGQEADPKRAEEFLREAEGISGGSLGLSGWGQESASGTKGEGEREGLSMAFARAYRKLKQRDKLLDYSDMLTEARILLEEDPGVRARWSHRFQMILVDEAQDMDPLQFILVRILAEGYGNLFLVGDDDQSIYGFRGADPGILRHIRSPYPNASIIKLRTNYRSSPGIVEASQRLIRHNRLRYEKSIRADRAEGGRLVIRRLPDPGEEVRHIARSLRRREKEAAVLFRTRAQSDGLVRALRAEGIPFYMRQEDRTVCGHWLTRDVLSYLHLALGERRREDLLRIMNRPHRMLPRSCVEEGEFDWTGLRRQFDASSVQAKGILELERDLHFMSRASPYAALTYLLGKVGYRSFLEEEYGGKAGDREEIELMLGMLMRLAREIGGRGEEALKTYLKRLHREELPSWKENPCEGEETGPPVGLFTFHGSKGLEFDQVYIMDVNEGVTPSSRAESEAAMEEERRIFYVALTRARREVFLYSCLNRGNKKLAPSRFLAELQKEEEGKAISDSEGGSGGL